MARITIPWNDGNGNIVLTLTGQGNDTVTVSSDTDNLDYERRQTISFYVTDGAIREDLAASGAMLRTSDGLMLTCLDARMKVSVEVVQIGKQILLASGATLKTKDGRVLRVFPSN